jgi:hypothetical protein
MCLGGDDNYIYFIEATFQYYADISEDIISNGYIGFVKGFSNLNNAIIKIVDMREKLLEGLKYNHGKRLLIGRLNEITDYRDISNAKTTDILYFSRRNCIKIITSERIIDKNIVIKDILDEYFDKQYKVIFNEFTQDFEFFDLLECIE